MREGSRVRPAISVVAVFVLACGLVGLPGSASASAGLPDVTFHKGVLTVTAPPKVLQAQLWVSCSAGLVTIPNDPPSLGSVPCTKVKALHIVGNEVGDNVQLGNVTAVAFPNLAHVTIDVGKGDDYVIPSPLHEDRISGGPGTDRIQNGSGGSLTITDTTFAAGGQPVDPISSFERVTGYGANGADDTLDASAFSGGAEFHGNSGNDTLIGGVGNDTLYGDDGNDTMDGGSGDDSLSDMSTGTNEAYVGGPGTDSASVMSVGSITITDSSLSGTGADTIAGVESIAAVTSGPNSSINAAGFSGRTVLVADPGTGTNTLTAGQGGSLMRAYGASDAYVGGAGTDRIQAYDATWGVLTNGTFADALATDSLTSIEEAEIEGTAGADTFNGSNFSGDISWTGHGGVDDVTTGPGDDFLSATTGTVAAGAGTDVLYTNVSSDFVLTDSAAGAMAISGIERFESDYSSVPLTFDGSGFSGDIKITAGDGKQTIIGGSGDDILRGGVGNDRISGGAGKDSLSGDAGNDRLNGGLGTDTCKGGNGADTFKACEKTFP